MPDEETIIDGIYRHAGINTPVLYHYLIKITKDHSAPFFDRCSFAIQVGEEWLSDVNWAQLIAMRLQGDLNFRQDGDVLSICTVTSAGGILNKVFSTPVVNVGFAAEELEKAIRYAGISMAEATKSLNNFGSIMGTINA